VAHDKKPHRLVKDSRWYFDCLPSFVVRSGCPRSSLNHTPTWGEPLENQISCARGGESSSSDNHRKITGNTGEILDDNVGVVYSENAGGTSDQLGSSLGAIKQTEVRRWHQDRQRDTRKTDSRSKIPDYFGIIGKRRSKKQGIGYMPTLGYCGFRRSYTTGFSPLAPQPIQIHL